jgi:hypothetical protein
VKVLWEMNMMDGKNPIHTGGFLTAYDHREFSPEEVLARESGQNSMDAGRKIKGVTQLVFQKLIATGEGRKRLIKLLECDQLLKHRIKVFEREERNNLFVESVKEFLDGPELHALLVRDFNTCGLGGRWDRYEKGDHFARLVCALNLDDKADGDATSGGSFGLGKTTYAKSSNINTVIYHSVFDESEDTNGVNRRLMGAGVFPKHSLGGKNYGGFAYFGKSSDGNSEIAEPFENEDAEKLWHAISEAFGVDMDRQRNGTDILIFMDAIDLSKLKAAIEDYYFPALINGELFVQLIDEERNIEQPSVLSREDLDQFVGLYKKAKGDQVIRDETLRVDALQRLENHKIGRVAFEAAEPDEAISQKNNCVAIMRGTGMVINYVKMGGDQYEPAVGVFQADEEIYKYLQLAENAAHSEWSEHSRRLLQNHPKIGKKLISRVNNAVRKRFLDFQKELQPDVSITRSESGLLARLLTGALSGSKGDVGPEKSFHNPVSLNLTQRRRADEKSVWRLQVHDCEHTPESPFTLNIFPSISLAGESRKIAIKHMDFMIKDSEGQILAQGTKPELTFNFSKGKSLDFNVEFSNPGRHNYIVQCKCVAENGNFDVE